MSEFRNRRLEVGRVKAERIGATGAKIVATSGHNCIGQITELSRHYKLGVVMKNTCELAADALVLPSKVARKEVAMPIQLATEFSQVQVSVDEQGYLKEPSLWDWNVARFVASEEGVGELTEERRQIIEYVREYYNY